MKNYTKILLQIENVGNKIIGIDSIDVLTEIEIYINLSLLFPYYISINTDADISIFQQGYEIKFLHGLNSVCIYQSKQ